ncbi:MAG: penicillin acylase family protein [Spirochaetota bacterium]
MKKKILNFFYSTSLLLLLFLIYLPLRLLYQIPKENGNLKVPGIREKVEVFRDAYGIPHIFAYNRRDAYFALGYIQASERLFQIQMLKRVIAGRLSEVIGKKGLVLDRLFRTLGFRRNFSRWLAENRRTLSAKDLELTNAFVAGLNEFSRSGETPLEMQVLGMDAERIDIEDLLALVAFISYSFAEPFRVEPALFSLQEKVGKDKLQELISEKKMNDTFILQKPQVYWHKQYLQLYTLVQDTLSSVGIPIGNGSNSWAIAPKRSKSGYAILANDPHMNYGNPSLWFEAYINYPGFELYGQFLPLTPFAAIGFNSHLGWGMTIFPYDNVDFYQEKTNPNNPNQVLFANKIIDIKTREEVIKVRFSQDVICRIRETHNGPIISGLVKNLKKTSPPVSVKWNVFSKGNNPLAFFTRINEAKSLQEFRSALPLLKAPGINLSYADKKGNIAFFAVAGLVERDFATNFLLAGDSPTLQWKRQLNFSKNPQQINPDSGVIWHANNPPSDATLPGYWQPIDRAKRLATLLQGRGKFSYQEMQDMQIDIHVNAKHLLQTLQEIPSTNLSQEEDKLRKQLLQWDRKAKLSSNSMSLYANYQFFLSKAIFFDEMQSDIFNALSQSSRLQRYLHTIVKNRKSSWWDDSTTSEKETVLTVSTKAWKQTVQHMKYKYGKNWQWQKLHQLELKHPFSNLPLLHFLYTIGPVPIAGGKETVNNQMSDFAANDHKPIAGPAFRMLVEFSQATNFSMILPSGNSGHVLSEHYDDQFHLFTQGKVRTNSLARIRQKKEENLLILSPARTVAQDL